MSLSVTPSNWQTQLEQCLYAEMQPSLNSLKTHGIPLNPHRIASNKIYHTTQKIQKWIQNNCPSPMRETTSQNLFTLTKIALDGILVNAIHKIRPGIYKDTQSYMDRIEFDENDFVDRITTEPEQDLVEISEPVVEESKHKRKCWEDTQLAHWMKHPSSFWRN